jgi:biopolymer transport protein ExbD
MQRPPNYRSERGRLEANMTPMIDVIFNLLIFFVCTVSFQPPEEVLPTHLSALGVAASVPRPPEIVDFDDVVVKVLLRGEDLVWEINREPYASLAQVRDVLASIAGVKRDLPVIIDAQGEVPLGSVIDIYDLCRLAGFQKVHFAAHQR